MLSQFSNGKQPGLKKIMILKKNQIFLFKSDFFFLFDLFEVWYIDIYIDVYIYKLFQTCSIQIDLVHVLTEGTRFLLI